jgi:hypothetical protein
VYLQPTESGRRGQWAWGKPQPSRFTFISSSGPVLAPIQLDQSGDINLDYVWGEGDTAHFCISAPRGGVNR